MYDNYKLCSELRCREVCVVVEQHRAGQFDRVHRAHIPSRRLSKDRILNMLRALVCRFNGRTGLGFDQIVSSYVNDRSGSPSQYNPFQITVAYPEPGVLRTYCGTDTKAWADEVISKSSFRAANNEES
jgi:hypothetical protein